MSLLCRRRLWEEALTETIMTCCPSCESIYFMLQDRTMESIHRRSSGGPISPAHRVTNHTNLSVACNERRDPSLPSLTRTCTD